MSRQPTYDLPGASGNGSVALLLDANAGNYSTLPNGQGVVFIEKYAIRKPFIQRQTIGTPSSIRPNAYLVRETNYRDVGGGWFEFERHYAPVPTDWFDYELVGAVARVSRLNRFIEIGDGQQLLQRRITRVTIFSANSAGSGNVETVPVLAKATRSYALKQNLPTQNELLPETAFIRSPFLGANDTYTSPEFVPKLPEITLFNGTIYEIKNYTAVLRVRSVFSP
jgi:hypothetical protein